MRISFHFSFFAILAILTFLKNQEIVLLGFISCIFHELGHLAVMKLIHCPVHKIIFYGSGIKIQRYQEKLLPFWEEFFFLSGGCIVNFLVGLMMFLPDSPSWAVRLGTVSLVTGIFNLLPFSAFDGGKLIRLTAEKCSDFFVYYPKLLTAWGIFFSAVLGIWLYFKGVGNLSFYLTLAYFSVSEIVLEHG